MADTFVKIATVTVGAGGASTMDFTSIPSTYTDLCIKISARDNSVSLSNAIGINFNSATGNWSQKYLIGDGSSASSGSNAYGLNPNYGWAGYTTGSTATSNTFSNNDIYIPNYAGSTYKSVSVDSVTENNGTTGVDDLNALLWSNTAAITSISLSDGGGGNFVQYSTATLYGIKNS